MAANDHLSAAPAALEPAVGGGFRDTLTARWAALAPRERTLLAIAAAVLAAFVLWAVALAPAWRASTRAPAQLDQLDQQLRRMQALASEAKTLRAVTPVPLAQAQQALSAASERLGTSAKLSLQGERAVLTLRGVSGAQLSGWLAEARAGARARVTEATLDQASPGLYSGSLSLAFGPGGAR